MKVLDFHMRGIDPYREVCVTLSVEDAKKANEVLTKILKLVDNEDEDTLGVNTKVDEEVEQSKRAPNYTPPWHRWDADLAAPVEEVPES